MRYQLAIFDFDGTLADSYPWFAAQFNTIAERFGCRAVQAHEIEQMRGLHSRQIMAEVGLKPWRLPALLRYVRQQIARDAASIGLFDGIAPTLVALHERGVQLAVASSNSEQTVRQVLGESLVGRIAHLRCGASMFGKQAHFRHLMRRCGLHPSQVLCIGDELRDAEAARAVRLDFGAVSWGYTRADVLAPHSTHLFATPPAILAAFA